MNIIKKTILDIILFFAIFLVGGPVVSASCKISVSAPSSVIVGQDFKVNVIVSASPNLGNFDYVLSYDSSKVRLQEGSLKQSWWSTSSSGQPSVSRSYTFKALTSGTATFTPIQYLVSYINETDCSPSVSSASVTMKTQAEIEAGYSKNNNLGSLSVEGAELSPAFNKDVTEYTATLPVDTTKAKIIATAADSKASITGAGEIDVVDGLNKVEITVTAEHGEKKTYVINLTVQELDPIKVKVNGKNYTIVRKAGQVENIPVGFAETKIKIGEQEVVAYQSELTKLVLVALKDDEGNVNLYIYDKNKKSYTSFREAKGPSINLLILDKALEEVPSDFESTSFKYNGMTIDGYKLKNDDKENYYLVYAQNLETGNKGFYLYDKKDGSFQRYFSDLVDTKNKQLFYLFCVAAGLLGLFVLIIIFKIISGVFTSKERKINKYKRKINKLQNKSDNIDNDEYDIDDVDERPVIKKVEEDEYVIPKKSRKEKLKELEEAKKRLDKNKPNYRRISLEEDED